MCGILTRNPPDTRTNSLFAFSSLDKCKRSVNYHLLLLFRLYTIEKIGFVRKGYNFEKFMIEMGSFILFKIIEKKHPPRQFYKISVFGGMISWKILCVLTKFWTRSPWKFDLFLWYFFFLENRIVCGILRKLSWKFDVFYKMFTREQIVTDSWVKY